MNKNIKAFLDDVLDSAKKNGIPDYAVFGIDIESNDFQEISIGTKDMSNSNRVRTLNMIGLMREAENSLLQWKNDNQI